MNSAANDRLKAAAKYLREALTLASNASVDDIQQIVDLISGVEELTERLDFRFTLDDIDVNPYTFYGGDTLISGATGNDTITTWRSYADSLLDRA